ncbi:hypothetical protein BCR34DRAFT_316417 [Clohesyomyces aquaticus]|uniref:Uncharacterized protein n=1 Tax=Clohesyomyces aquaticus TaxID=1231657 RepID=A0A1Y1ZN95_9PLEO|nr:hypothetical protein BCR34DRAFT_316417 [Clohesyomyces aquaticus]
MVRCGTVRRWLSWLGLSACFGRIYIPSRSYSHPDSTHPSQEFKFPVQSQFNVHFVPFAFYGVRNPNLHPSILASETLIQTLSYSERASLGPGAAQRTADCSPWPKTGELDMVGRNFSCSFRASRIVRDYVE